MASNNQSSEVEGALSELKQQYNDLVEEIKEKHQEQQKLFEDMAKTDYDGEDYDADRINHLIEANVANLKEQRDKIWSYLTETYDKNTRTTYTNFRELKQNEDNLRKYRKQKEELNRKVSDIKNQNNTQKKLIQHNLYQHKKIHNKTFIQFVVLVALLSCVLLLYLSSIDTISTTVAWVSVGVIGFITVCYYLYRMYMYRMNRDQHYWHKVYFKKVDPTKPSDSDNVLDQVDYDKLDKEAKKLFSEYQDSCKSQDVVTIN